MSRFAKIFTTYYVEECFYSEQQDGYSTIATPEAVTIVQLHLNGLPGNKEEEDERCMKILHDFFHDQEIHNYIFWYYTPMAMAFTHNFHPALVVYDCMDELAAFKFASPSLKKMEEQLLAKADIVFTGGQSLFEAKRHLHSNIYPFPSSIDKDHFGAARNSAAQPTDQFNIPHPRLGFFGVIDERFDIDLIKNAADLRPDWQFVLIGPVVKIDPASLPQKANIHYLGSKTYTELPAYISGWDIALIPFALNESTQFISPTKTPEYLAAGKPVIATAIRDVVAPYAENGLVRIVANAVELVHEASEELAYKDKNLWLSSVDAFLAPVSWDATWNSMVQLMQYAQDEKQILLIKKNAEDVRLFGSGSRTGRVRVSRKVGEQS